MQNTVIKEDGGPSAARESHGLACAADVFPVIGVLPHNIFAGACQAMGAKEKFGATVILGNVNKWNKDIERVDRQIRVSRARE